MKKRKTNKFISPILKGIVAFGVFGLALYVYAAVTYPPEPHPVGGVVGIFVGLSDGGYDDAVDSYSDMNAKCNTYIDYTNDNTVTDSGAHVCTPMEVMNTYNNVPDVATLASGVGILNSGPPGYTVYANDCDGWTIKAHTFNGAEALAATWSFATDSASLASCGAMTDVGGVYNNPNVKAACCK